MIFLKRLEFFFDFIAKICAAISFVALILLVCFVFFNVCARYFFQYGNVGLQEMEWHCFAAIFLFGMTYALKEDAHVRVDVFYENLKPKNKALINMFGAIIFIVPFTLLVSNLSYSFVYEAFTSMEKSPDPGGLSYRWIIKSLIPVCFWILFIYSIGFFIKNLNLYLEYKVKKNNTNTGE